jgi:uncharacterized membrane protein
MGRTRVEAFSDGVMAVAITLLVLDLHTSAASSDSLLVQLAKEWPAFLAYVLSFFVVGTIWVNHHLLFNVIVKVDRLTLALNLILLLFVCTIPFTTSQLADFVIGGGQNLRVAVVIYGAVAEGMSISFTLILKHVIDAGLTSRPITRRERQRQLIRFGVGLVLYPLATVIGLVAPLVMMVGLTALSIYYLVGQSALSELGAPEVSLPEAGVS